MVLLVGSIMALLVGSCLVLLVWSILGAPGRVSSGAPIATRR